MKAKKIEDNVFLLESNGELCGLLYQDDNKIIFLNKTDRKETLNINDMEIYLGDEINFPKIENNDKDNNLIGKYPIRHNINDVEILEENETPYYIYKNQTYFAGYYIFSGSNKIVFCPTQTEVSSGMVQGVYTTKDKAEMELKLITKQEIS